MGKHVLFQLNPWFEDRGEGPFYCPDCAAVQGFFHYSPEVENKIDIIHVDYQRPRKAVVDLLGQGNQGCPVLVLDKDTPVPHRQWVTENLTSYRRHNENFSL